MSATDEGGQVDGTVRIDEGLVYAIVRYALGRATYVVSWTVREVIRVTNDLSPNTRAVILRDVTQWLDENRDTTSALVRIDTPEWQRLHDHLDGADTGHGDQQ